MFEPEPFCNFYIAWSRNRFPERARAPISVWWFNTGAASEFVPEVAKLALDSEGLDPNEPINRETSRLNKLAAVAAEPSALRSCAICGHSAEGAAPRCRLGVLGSRSDVRRKDVGTG